MRKNPKILAVVGPTASGKSDLAVDLALRFGGEVVSADSRQVYRGLDIGSGKITAAEARGVPHHLLDVADPAKAFTAADFQRLGYEAVNRILSRGKLPIVAGGTGFYVSALVDGVSLPPVPPNEELRRELAGKPAAELFDILSGLDPGRAETIDPDNPVRLIRAIEIASALGKVPVPASVARYNPLFIGIFVPKEQLENKIRRRLEARLETGLIEEVENLHRSGLTWERLEELGLEYRYVALRLQGKLSADELEDELYSAIVRYAKRQMTWFKRDQRIRWITSPEEAIAVVEGFLK